MTSVVVGFIDSPEGRAAISAAANEAEQRQLRLLVINSSRGGKEDRDLLQSTRDALTALDAELRGRNFEFEILEYARGLSPAEDLLQVAQENEAELLVIGLRRRTSVGKFIMGSNAQDILLAADCPVLAVKAPAGS